MSQQLTIIKPYKVPMDYAATALAELCERIDSGEPLSDALTVVFNDTKLDLADAVDRRIAFDTWIKGAIAAADNAAHEWQARAKKLEMMRDAFIERTKAIVEANPDMPYQGKLGTLKIRKNNPAVQLAFNDKALTADMIALVPGLADYAKAKTTWSVDKLRIAADLKAGEELPWATLTQGTRLEVRK